MKLLKKTLKIAFVILLLLLVGFYVFFVNFSAPKSNLDIIESFSNNSISPVISQEKYNGFEFRKLSMQQGIDTTKFNIVFVHGAIGSSIDFKRYMADSLLLEKANIFSYDRVGYNYKDKYLAQGSIAFEVEILQEVLKNLDPKNTVIIGYSYGGPIALALKKRYKNILLLAPAVYSKVEPMPWMLNFYKWKITRWLVPNTWKSASLEKLSHKKELEKYETKWNKNLSQIVSIHGDADQIVPYDNSIYLEKHLSNENFKLITLKNTGHSLVWSNFETIRRELLKLLN